MNSIFEKRALLKKRLRNRERLFAGWVSYSHPSITETFSRAGFDFMFIDMEHSTITVEQGQRIIAACQSEGVACIPRPVSHSNDYLKPILESGADGVLVQMVETSQQVEALICDVKYPPEGHRTYGVNRAQAYGFDFEEYIHNWNKTSTFMLQVESIKGVDNIEQLLEFDEVDGVMIGPLDIAGSLGVPGQTTHPLVLEASRKVIEACKRHGKSCGTQVADATPSTVKFVFDLGYNYAILGSDLFVLWKWATQMKEMMNTMR
ncbi:aldolase/citrate lyase family protein [Alphaproteobacteria bacterium]|nr:aldolase/citrate lyase family protein [Alphaproteobacteria bacterium]